MAIVQTERVGMVRDMQSRAILASNISDLQRHRTVRAKRAEVVSNTQDKVNYLMNVVERMSRDLCNVTNQVISLTAILKRE